MGKLSFFAAALLLSVSSSFAQSTYATVSGTVSDEAPQTKIAADGKTIIPADE